MGNASGRIERQLLCALTDEEVQSRGRMLGETVSKMDSVNRARTETMKGFKETLTGLSEEQRKLACILRDRAEWRMVACAVLFHVPGEGVKRIVRTDTGEVIGEEKMTDGEKQLNLFAAQSEFEVFMRDNAVAESQTGLAPLGPEPEPPDEDPDGEVSL